jgi:enoyl-CoA hydratase
MERKTIKLSREERIAIVHFNRPEALNALNTEMLMELDGVMEELAKDAQVDVIILTGEGKAFVAGADIGEMSGLTAEEGRKFGVLGQQVFRKLELLEKPTIAAINGFALGGGCELAMSCDIRIASEKAKFGQPEVGLGITPGFSGTQRLTRLIGISKAKEWIFTGDVYAASEAEKVGLVNKVVPHEVLLEEALKISRKIVSKAQLAVRYAKIAMNRGIEVDIDTGVQIEADLFGLCFATHDQKEGMAAFLEKRKPNFQGK